MKSFLGAIVLMELMARIVSTEKRPGPYLVGLTAAEPLTEFERRLMEAMEAE